MKYGKLLILLTLLLGLQSHADVVLKCERSSAPDEVADYSLVKYIKFDQTFWGNELRAIYFCARECDFNSDAHYVSPQRYIQDDGKSYFVSNKTILFASWSYEFYFDNAFLEKILRNEEGKGAVLFRSTERGARSSSTTQTTQNYICEVQ